MRPWRDVPPVYVYRDVVDFRKSINGLVLIVEHEMGQSPYADALYVFCNRARDKLKLVYWDKTGFCLWYKRLEEAKFKWPRKVDEVVLTFDAEQFGWLLQGLDVMAMQRHNFLHYSAI